jgi:hypothetical protein
MDDDKAPRPGPGGVAHASDDEDAVAFWAPIQIDYEAGAESLKAIAAKHGITLSQLTWRARRRLWRPRHLSRRAGGSSLLARLFRLLERQVHQMEQERSPMGEKEAAVLGRVATTLEKLIQLERTAVPPKATKPHTKDLEELRKKIAQRFEEIAKP